MSGGSSFPLGRGLKKMRKEKREKLIEEIYTLEQKHKKIKGATPGQSPPACHQEGGVKGQHGTGLEKGFKQNNKRQIFLG